MLHNAMRCTFKHMGLFLCYQGGESLREQIRSLTAELTGQQTKVITIFKLVLKFATFLPPIK